MAGRRTAAVARDEEKPASAPTVAHHLNLPPPDRLLTVRDVLERVQMSQASLYRRLAAKTFPAPVRYATANLWRESTISAWIASLPEVDSFAGTPGQGSGAKRAEGARGKHRVP